MSGYIEFKNVKKKYKMGEVEIEALSGVDFSINKGEFVVVAGASGAGKSTILNILGGMDTASEGQVIVDQIANVEVVTRDSNAETGVDKPVNPPVMTTVTVDTFGVDYGEPQRVEPFDYYSWMMKNYGLDSSQTIVPGK